MENELSKRDTTEQLKPLTGWKLAENIFMSFCAVLIAFGLIFWLIYTFQMPLNP